MASMSLELPDGCFANLGRPYNKYRGDEAHYAQRREPG
jgi:hypothetical protein